MKVSKLMTADPVACGPEDSDGHAASLMWKSDCGVLPVVYGSRRVVGMITDRDLCMAGLSRGRPLGALRVADAMSREVQSCRAGDTVRSARKRMTAHHVRRLPVVDKEGKLVGVLSFIDLVRYVAGLDRGKYRSKLEGRLIRAAAKINAPRGDSA